MTISWKPWLMAMGALALTACGGTNSETSGGGAGMGPGAPTQTPPFRIASLDAAAFAAELGASSSGAQLLQLTGAPVCGVDFYDLSFATVGGAGETTESSGALMVPTGAAPACSGPRPIVLYAHGTEFLQTANIADITNPANAEGALIAAAFAAQGYIVVAPNYAGYDISTLGYHPYLNATQQSGEMLDALSAARTVLPKTLSSATSDSGKLFLTGYSQGGHVAMATQRAMLAAGMTVTAAAPMSGPYALEAYGDTIIFGGVPIGGTLFLPLLTTSYQHAYHNIYTTPGDIYAPAFAPGIETLLPNAAPYATLFQTGKLPQSAVFDIATPTLAETGNNAELAAVLALPPTPLLPLDASTPVFQAGFGSPFLVNNAYRVSYAADALTNPDPALVGLGAGLPATPPTHPLRLALYRNDLRTAWAPNSPTLLCGGSGDPTVFFKVNTLTMQAYWAKLPPGLVTVLDLNATPAGPFQLLQGAFQALQAATLTQQIAYFQSAAGGSLPLPQATLAAEGQVAQKTHGAEAPFCTEATVQFFNTVLKSGV